MGTSIVVTLNVHIRHHLFHSHAEQSLQGTSDDPRAFRDLSINLHPADSFYRYMKIHVVQFAHNAGVYESSSFVFSEPFALCLWNGSQFITIKDSYPPLHNGTDVFWVTESHASFTGKQYCSQLEAFSIAGVYSKTMKKFHQLEVAATPLSQQQWSCKFMMDGFPDKFDYLEERNPKAHVWSPARTVFTGLELREAGQRDEVAEKELSEMTFSKCRWLCPEGLMDPAIREQFAENPSGPVTPPTQFSMESPFDYLERAFVDLFGAWNPIEQSFKRAFPLNEVEGLYQESAWLPRILNRAFDTMPFFSQDFHDVCPWNGTAVLWMSADSQVHKNFITLVRHAHTLPYAPLPCTAKALGYSHEDNYAGTMFAVFQPIDDIQPWVLNDLEQAHRDRHAWQQKKRSMFQSAAAQDLDLKPSGSFKRTRSDASPAGGSDMMACPQQEPASLDTPSHDAHSLLPQDQYSFSRPTLPLEARLPYGLRYPSLPPLRQVELSREQVCAVIACDIDHTLINQVLSVTYHGPWGSNDARMVPDDLRSVTQVRRHVRDVHKWLSDRRNSARVYLNGLPAPSTNTQNKELNSIACEHLNRRLATIIQAEDGGIKRPEKRAEKTLFQPGSMELTDPQHNSKVRSPQRAITMIYPRRNLCDLIAACYPVQDGEVSMRFKPVFTTAGTQPYADTVITALKVLVLEWLDARKNSLGRTLTQGLHTNTDLARQQVNLFFRGPVISMAAARTLGPQVKRDRHQPEAEPYMPLKEVTVTKNFARFLLFGMLQHGALLHSLSAALTRRAAITLDDSYSAWGEEEIGLLMHLNPAKQADQWVNSTSWKRHINIHARTLHYMDALAYHGAEVEDELESDDEKLGEYNIVPAPKAELSIVAERLNILYELAMLQYPQLAPTTFMAVYNDMMHRSPAPLDQLLPVTRIMYDDHAAEMEQVRQKLEDAQFEIRQLEERILELTKEEATR